MVKYILRLMIVAAVSHSTLSFASYKGVVAFSKIEMDNHRLRSAEFSRIAAECLISFQNEHLQFFDQNCRNVGGSKVCLSKYFGDRRYSKSKNSKRSDGTPLQFLGDALREAGFPESYMDHMEATSCVGMTLTCLKQAFVQTNQSDQWEKVLNFTKMNGVGGTALQDALYHLGWRIYYWNPSPLSEIEKNNKKWDREELDWQSKGHHAYRYNKVMNEGTYWFNQVDDVSALVGFGSSEPQRIQNVPFWVGTAHTGYHVFPGTYGDVVEAHSTRHITAKDNLEFSRFSPFAPGGGPRWSKTEKYRSGLIAIPPGF